VKRTANCQLRSTSHVDLASLVLISNVYLQKSIANFRIQHKIWASFVFNWLFVCYVWCFDCSCV